MTFGRFGADRWAGLAKLFEECGELLQVAGKLQQTEGAPHHWDGSNLHERFEDEAGDVLAAIDFVLMHGHELDRERIAQRRLAKLRLFNHWHASGDTLPPKVGS